jgi:hypothetical protein
VESTVLAALRREGGPLAQAVAASEQLEHARRAGADAEHELSLYLEADLISVVGPDAFRGGVETRQRRIDTRAALAELQQQSQLGTELLTGDLLEVWPTLTLQEKSLLLHGLLDRVVVTRAKGRGASADPLERRVQIVLRGGLSIEPAVS